MASDQLNLKCCRGQPVTALGFAHVDGVAWTWGNVLPAFPPPKNTGSGCGSVAGVVTDADLNLHRENSSYNQHIPKGPTFFEGN